MSASPPKSSALNDPNPAKVAPPAKAPAATLRNGLALTEVAVAIATVPAVAKSDVPPLPSASVLIRVSSYFSRNKVMLRVASARDCTKVPEIVSDSDIITAPKFFMELLNDSS